MKNPQTYLLFVVTSCFSLVVTLTAAGQSVSSDRDTTKVKGEISGSQLEGPIQYEARIFDNFIDQERTILEGEASVKYMDIEIKAARISVDWKRNILLAEGMADTVMIYDPQRGDSVKSVTMRGLPEFSEAGDVMTGERMEYNFKTRRGRVQRGRTKFEDGFYTGRVMKVAGGQTAYIGDASFTTCDREEEPHFHFESKKMRIDMNKSVVAKPIVMYLGKIPVLALPFVYFPINKGRHSGLLLPRYGESSVEGRYLRGLGYYWAASDYWDVRGTVDYYEKSGFLFRGDLTYNVRYKLQGSISGSWTRKDFDAYGTTARRWDLNVVHSQIISPSLRVNASGTFVSSKDIYRELSASRDQRMRSQIRSNATITKQFGGSRSVTVNLSRVQELQNDSYTETLPRISFRGGRTALFKKPKADRGETIEAKWYNNIYLSYNSNFEISRRRSQNSDSSYTTQRDMGWRHDASLNSPQKIFRYLTVSPGINYQETWFNKQEHHIWDSDSNQVLQEEEKGFFARRTYDMSISFGTKIYGIFRSSLLPDVLVRHVMTPSLSFTYQPDYSSANFDYYDAVTDSSGKTTYYDRYGNSLFSGTPRQGRKSLNFSVQNLFQMKAGAEGKEKKLDLFSYNISTSYNWKAEEFKLGNISSSLRAQPTRNISLNIQALHSLYQTDSEGNGVDHYFMSDIDWSSLKSIFGSRWARMVNFSLDLRMNFKGTAAAGGSAGARESGSDSLAAEALSPSGYNIAGDRFNVTEDMGSFSIPWNLSTSLSYADSRFNPQNPSKRFWINTDLKFNLTKNWRISWQSRFDLMEKAVVSQDFTIHRDLHCWEAQFVWTPVGLYKRFYFRINIKSTMLQDIKFEKGQGRQGFSGSGLGSALY